MELSNDIKAYFEGRLRQYNISDLLNTIETPIYEGIDGGVKATEDFKKKVFFEAHEKGIKINYFQPNGHEITYKKEGNKWPVNFSRIRLAKENTYEKDGKPSTQKYTQEKGSPVVPFLTPGVIKKWIDGKEIETLFLIEGEFKAFKSWMEKSTEPDFDNFEFIGLPGIHGFYSSGSNHKKEINEILQQVIVDCKVKKIVLVMDADCLTLTYAEDKDLSVRCYSFANAVKNFRESLHLLLDDSKTSLQEVYFMHLKTKYNETAKGLDDLLLQIPAKKKEIFSDLLNYHFAKNYFSGILITDGQGSKVDNYFGTTAKEQFFNIYKDFIGSRPFIFKKIKYEWSGEELKYVKSEIADRFMRVGINWLKRIQIPNHRGLLEERVEKWSVAEIKRDYPKMIADRLINHDIPRYDTFYIEPCWDPTAYKRTFHDCYNLMEPLIWDPKSGRIDSTLMFLKHIFAGSGSITWDEEKEEYKEVAIYGDQYTIALDYLSIMHQHPKQKTFVPCLVSKEQRTGKTTFLEWLCTVYNGNGTILNNQRFQMNFNGHYATKFIIGLDEGFLDVDKKAEREKLKQMVTANSMFLEMKGIDAKEIPYFGHLIICSNDADNLMKMDEEDTRWFVVKVPQLKIPDPELTQKMKNEIPAWLHFIANRKIFHPKVDRLWFNPSDFETDQMRKIIQTTKARIDVVVENFIKDIFLTYKVEEVRINRKTMCKYLNNTDYSKYRIDEKELKYYLDEKKTMKYQPAARCKIPIAINGYNGDNIPNIAFAEEIQRHYLFLPEQWLTETEYEEYKEAFSFSENKQVVPQENLPF